MTAGKVRRLHSGNAKFGLHLDCPTTDLLAHNLDLIYAHLLLPTNNTNGGSKYVARASHRHTGTKQAKCMGEYEERSNVQIIAITALQLQFVKKNFKVTNCLEVKIWSALKYIVAIISSGRIEWTSKATGAVHRTLLTELV